ncbi:MAG TPA: peptidase M22 [Oscillospiraceae bacterium]|nr:peptidase M22 [Oscillospiraceae bacterium]
MACFLGIDTSNYTTSLAIYDDETGEMLQAKMPLPVKENEIGLRQSDAVFHHTKNLPELMEKCFPNNKKIAAAGVSVKPRDAQGSYMPCFLAGEGLARSVCAMGSIDLHKTSHQTGHILAAIFSCKKFEFLKQRFVAFHVSGGTTECLLVEPDEDKVVKISLIASSLDLKAGQAVDRIGVFMGLRFPCGPEMEELALESKKEYNIKPAMKGLDCCLSGIENKCRDMLLKNEKKEDVAKYCIDYIGKAVEEMTAGVLNEYGKLPVVYAGGVMSNLLIRKRILNRFEAYFANPEYSCDNAAGVAFFAALKHKEKTNEQYPYGFAD